MKNQNDDRLTAAFNAFSGRKAPPIPGQAPQEAPSAEMSENELLGEVEDALQKGMDAVQKLKTLQQQEAGFPADANDKGKGMMDEDTGMPSVQGWP